MSRRKVKGTEVARIKAVAFLATFAAFAAVACGTDGATVAGASVGADFSAVMNRDWILSEIRADFQVMFMDRERHIEMGLGDIFTIQFDGNRAFGTAMPNTFNGSYTLGDNDTMTFVGTMVVSTMASTVVPGEITEDEFISYLYNVFAWNLADENLELYTTNDSGSVAVLVFAPLEHN
jgi:heat shock protein HslJ